MFSLQLEIIDSELYKKAVDLDVLYKNDAGEVLNGVYNRKNVAYPDLTHSAIGDYFDSFINSLPVEYDGFVLTDNWPADDLHQFADNFTFPYISEVSNQKTLNTWWCIKIDK